MGRKKPGPEPSDYLGSLEARIMDTVWQLGPSTVGDVLEHLNATGRRQLAYNSVMSVMSRLADKGYLVSPRKRGKAFVYEAVSDREGFIRQQATTSATALLRNFDTIGVAGFVESVRGDSRLLRELERLLNEDEPTTGP